MAAASRGWKGEHQSLVQLIDSEKGNAHTQSFPDLLPWLSEGAVFTEQQQSEEGAASTERKRVQSAIMRKDASAHFTFLFYLS